MAIPADIETWIKTHRPCLEGVERLVQHASMAAAWDASTHGPFLVWLLKREDKFTDEAHTVFAKHAPRARAARKAARHQSDVTPQVFAVYAEALKSVVPNPFT